MEWFRWYHGAISDDKWPLAARKSGQPVAVVVAVWAALLECASQAEDRGCIAGFDPESLDALLQVPDGTSQAVLEALSAGSRPRVSGGRIIKWDERQPLREREDLSTTRTRLHRGRQKKPKADDVMPEAAGPEQKSAPKSQGTPGNASGTPAERRGTPGNAIGTPAKRQGTPRSDQKRSDQSRDPDPQPPGAVNGLADARAAKAFPEGGRPVGKEDFANIEFEEIRACFDELIRPEAPRTGWTEYKRLKAAGGWPGRNAIFDALDLYAQAYPEPEDKAYVPGLARFLREGWWKTRPEPRARRRTGETDATPALDPTIARNMSAAQQVLQRRSKNYAS